MTPRVLLSAYSRGIFPWYQPGTPIQWWSPDPRTVLPTDRLHLSRSLKRQLRRGSYRVSADSCFAEVIRLCAATRPESWITEELAAAFCRLHRQGWTHSIEVWQDQTLVGGLYGISMGTFFAGESMFSLCPDASKVAMAHLCRQLQDWGFSLMDCQAPSPHLFRLGARQIPRAQFLRHLRRSILLEPPVAGSWQQAFSRYSQDSW